MIGESQLMKAEKLNDMLDECLQLARILSASITTARKNMKEAN